MRVTIGFSPFIISTFPLAVPLEWNVQFMYRMPGYERVRRGVGEPGSAVAA